MHSIFKHKLKAPYQKPVNDACFDIIETKCIKFDNIALNGLMVQKLLVSAQTSPGSLSDTVGALSNTVQQLQNQVTALQNQVNEIVTTLNDLDAFIAIVKNNSIVFQK